METPLNVQTVTEKVMRDQQDITLGQSLRNVSGVTVPGGPAGGAATRSGGIYVRGFRTNNIYRDGVRIDNSFGYDLSGTRQLANVESIEVLKGPAAILYGLSEPGGIINIITKEPKTTPYVSVNQQVGSLALYRTTFDTTGPLTKDKTVLYRINGSYENNGAPFGSFIDSTHSQSLFIAPVVKWQIDPSMWVKLEMEYNDDDSSLYRAMNPSINGSFITTPRNTNYYGPTSDHLRTLFTALTWKRTFDENWSVKQQIAYLRVDDDYKTAPPLLLTPGANPIVTRVTNIQNAPQDMISTNVDIVGHLETAMLKHTILIGGDYYGRTSNTQGTTLAPWGWSQVSLLNPGYPVRFVTPLVSAGTLQTANRQNTAGAYIQDQITLPYDFFVLAGARYQYIYQQNASRSASGVLPWLPLAQDGAPLEKAALTPRFGLLWRPREWVSFYGNYTEGFGPNPGLVYPSTLAPPSNARSWEAGIKLELFDGRLIATADYYDLVKTNIPIADPDPTHICGPGPCVRIAGEAHSRGPELDIKGEVLPGWDLIITYANQDVRISKGGAGGLQTSGLSPGMRFPHVPRNLASLWSTYEFQDATLKGLKVGAGYTYHGSQPIYYPNALLPGVEPLLPSWGTVDLMSAYSFTFNGARFTAQLNVNNLFDRTYYTDAVVYQRLTRGTQLNSARTYGAPFSVLGSLRAEF